MYFNTAKVKHQTSRTPKDMKMLSIYTKWPSNFVFTADFTSFLENPRELTSLKNSNIIVVVILVDCGFAPEEKEKDLHPADDGEASEESHSASNETQLGLRLDLLVSLDVVEGGRVKVDLHQLEG